MSKDALLTDELFDTLSFEWPLADFQDQGFDLPADLRTRFSGRDRDQDTGAIRTLRERGVPTIAALREEARNADGDADDLFMSLLNLGEKMIADGAEADSGQREVLEKIARLLRKWHSQRIATGNALGSFD